MLYSNVKLNPELQPELFHHEVPADAPVTDLTEHFSNFVEQTAAMKAEQKKAEAAREGNDLPQQIQVPRVPECLVVEPLDAALEGLAHGAEPTGG